MDEHAGGETENLREPHATEDGSGPAPRLRQRLEESAEPVLVEMLGSPLSDDEAVLWAALTPTKRQAAVRRLTALRDWKAARGTMSVADAAIAAGMSASRFYRLASDWRGRPSIASLGVLATADRSTAAGVKPHVNALLLKVVPGIVGSSVNSSVRAQVAKLRETVAITLGEDLPGESRLRQYVEQERRRVTAKAEVANYLVFDCVACSLVRPDGRPWVLFALIDRASGLVIGFQLGETAESARAFVTVVSDALLRMGAHWSAGVPWASLCQQIAFVVGGDGQHGPDLEYWFRIRGEAGRGSNSGVNFLPVTGPRRHGRFFRKLVGPRIGRLVLSSAATADARVSADATTITVDAKEALLMIEGEVARHNEGILARIGGGVTGAVPPANLVGLFERLVRDPSLFLSAGHE